MKGWPVGESGDWGSGSAGCGFEPLDQGKSQLGRCTIERKNKPPGLPTEQAQQFSQVGPGGGEYGVDRVAAESCQEASSHPMIAFEMADLRFDCAATASAFAFGAGRVLFALPGNVHVGTAGVAVTSIPFIDVHIGDAYARDTLDRDQRLTERVAVVRIVFTQP